jgi:hypothetical protein
MGEMNLDRGTHGRAFDAPWQGVVDFVDERGVVSRAQDVTAILEANKQEQMEDRFKGFRKAPDFRRVASIPVAVVDIAKAQGLDLLNNPDHLKFFLNDPDNRAFRTTLERV